jgi:amino acid transporter
MAAPNTVAEHHDEDAAHLAALGYEVHFKRELRLRDTFALGFTYLSPLVGIYSLFAFAIDEAGPPAFWTVVLAGAGQFLVALVFGEIVSQFPIAGGLYPWARRLWGRRYAWMTGWVYMWALLITIAAVAYGAGPFAAALFGVESSVNFTIGTALVLLGIAAVVNFSGTKNLSRVATLGFLGEVTGVVVVGLILIIFHAEQSPSVVFDASGGPSGTFLGGFLAAALIGMYQFYGFEACGDVAEEVADAGRRIPRAMQLTILIGGATALLLMLAFILAIPDMDAAVNGEDADPIATIFAASFGDTGAKFFFAVAMISFLSCVLSLQAAASRLIYSYGRDDMIIGSRLWARFDHKRAVPPFALLVAAVIPAALVVGSIVSTDALIKLISFGAVGIYIAFQMVVLAALRARVKGWVPTGKYRMQRWAMPVNIGALVYGVAAIVNICWPRTPDAPWYDNYTVLLMSVIVIALGLLYMALARSHNNGSAPYGDAITGRSVESVAATAPSTPVLAGELDVH